MRRISALFACSIASGLLTACSEGVKVPLAYIDAPPPSVNAGSYVLLNGSASQDPQSRPLSYAWSFLERPLGSNATLVDEHTATPSFLADAPGTYVLQLIVSNSVLTSTGTTVSVQVSTCGANAPVITGPLHASKNPLNIGETTQLTAFVTDADNESPCNLNQTLSYSWVLIQQPAGSTAALNSERSETPSLIPDKSGDYMVRLTVTDSTGLSSDPKALILTVTDCTTMPIEWGLQPITAIAKDPQAGAPSFTDGNGNPMPHVGALVQLTPHATVPAYCGSVPTGPLSWSWTLSSRASESEAALDSSTTESPSIRIDKNGHYGISVVATDALGNRSTPKTIELDTTSCGVNRVTTLLLTGAGAPLVSSPQAPVSVGSFAPFTIAAQIATDDNLATACPARFRVSADFSYRLAIQPAYGAGSLSNVFGDSTVFEARAAGAYAVDVDGAVTNLAGRVHAPPAFVYLSAASCSPPALSIPRLSVGGSTSVFKGDLVGLTVDVVPGNCGAISSQLTYSWTLSRPPGSAATLTSATSATPSFIPDVAGASFAVSVAVTDGQGNTSTSQTLVIATSSCGNSPIFAEIADTPGARPFDDHTFAAVPAAGRTTFSDDDTACPARFAGQYSFSWSVVSSAPSVGYAFDTTSGSTVHFTPGGNAVYSVKLVVKSPTQRAEVMKLVAVSCPDVFPKVDAISIASSTPGYVPGKFFLGDTATLSATSSSLCYSDGSTAYSHLWSFQRLSGGSATLNSTIASQPTFTVDMADGSWQATVIVVDKLGNRSQPSAFTNFNSEPCSINPVVVSLSGPTRPSGGLPFDPYAFTASAHSNDDDPVQCPARFAQTYSFAFGLTSNPARPLSLLLPGSVAGVLSGASATSTLKPGGNATYTVAVHASGSKSGNGADTSQEVMVLCSDPQPTKVTTPSIASVTPPGGSDGFTRAAGQFFRDDTLTLTATASSTCFSPGNAGFLYSWILSPANPPTLNGATTQTPSFTVNTPGGAYTVSVAATDSIQNFSERQNTFTADSCGANPVLARIVDVTAGLAFDPHSLSVAPLNGSLFSTDDDATACPSRFAQTYSYSWSIVAPGGVSEYLFSPTAGATADFAAGENGTYDVSVVVTGAKQGSDTAHNLIDVVCAAPAPAVIMPVSVTVSDPDGYLKPGHFFAGDDLTVAGSATHACYTGANFKPTFGWSLTSSDPDTRLAAGTTSATFHSSVPQGGYALTFSVADQWNHTAASTAAFLGDACGANPVDVTVTTAQNTGMLAFDPWTVSALASSKDDDSSFCPPRFGQTYSIAWAVSAFPQGATKYVLSPQTGPQTVFAEGESASGAYGIRSTATGNKSGVSGSGTATITTAACGAPAPTFAIGIAQVTPPVPDPYYAGHPDSFFNGDSVRVSAAATFACYTNQAVAAPTYAWSLATDAFPTPALTPTAGAPSSASFTADQPNRTYHTRVEVADHWGNSNVGLRDLISGGCGVSPISAAITAAQAPDAKPMDDWTLTGVGATGAFLSDDSDPSKCPARFAPTYQFAWSLNPDVGGGIPAGTFSSTSTNPTTFTPGTHRLYSVLLVVSGNGQNGARDQAVNANCDLPVVETPVVAAVNGAPPSPTIFVGDVVKVTTPVTSQCFAHPSLGYTYTLTLGGGQAAESFVPSANDAQPSFQPQTFGGAYQVSVTVSDASGQSGSPTAPLQINVSSCGSADPTVLASVATQRFDAILQGITGTPAASAPLTITQSQGSLTPQVQVDFGGTPHSVAVPFYLNRQIGVDVTISIPTSCPNVRFTGAQLQDPHFELIPADQWNQPGPTTVTAGQTLHFSFVPSIGDEKDSTGIHPGFYSLLVNLAFGSTNEPIVTFVRPDNPINVGGRCGTNVPFADAVFTASSVQVGTLIGINATTSSDADNDVLAFALDNTSTGCGLQQRFTYAWFVQAAPSGSAAQVLPGTGAAQFTFTPDFPGGYDLALHVTDDTAAPAGPKTGTKIFPVAADAGLMFTRVPPFGTTSVPLSDVIVTFTTAQGTDCTTCTGTVTLSASGPGTLGGTLSKSGTGSVIFTGLTLSAVGDYTLSAVSDIGGAATSNGIIRVTDPQLSVAVATANPRDGVPFDVTVTARDIDTNPLSFSGSVELSVCNAGGLNCILRDTQPMNGLNVTFSVTLTPSDATYTLRAHALGAVNGLSDPVTVVP